MIQFSKNEVDLHMSSIRSTMKKACNIKLCATYNFKLKALFRLRDSSSMIYRKLHLLDVLFP